MDHGIPRIRAARWVIALGRLYGGLLVVAAAWSLLGAVVTWSPAGLLVAALLAGAAGAWGALIRAFERHRRGGWQLLVAVTAVGALAPVAGWLASGPVTVSSPLSLAMAGSLLVLLLHPDSRDWVVPSDREVRPPGVPAPTRREDTEPARGSSDADRGQHAP